MFFFKMWHMNWMPVVQVWERCRECRFEGNIYQLSVYSMLLVSRLETCRYSGLNGWTWPYPASSGTSVKVCTWWNQVITLLTVIIIQCKTIILDEHLYLSSPFLNKPRKVLCQQLRDPKKNYELPGALSGPESLANVKQKKQKNIKGFGQALIIQHSNP